MVGQIRRASRSVCTNISEGWRKRRYQAHFVSKFSDAETEAEETRVWLEFAWRCSYMSKAEADKLDNTYDKNPRPACANDFSSAQLDHSLSFSRHRGRVRG